MLYDFMINFLENEKHDKIAKNKNINEHMLS